ncbi:hypothetical protein BD289DRAFT_225192 [Coniella lustricola]|uniref:Uncharacterized protein n=1 Tax=Coniella lustricola TaxID=2025994 RepID=A0A2T3AAQ5_9PEZI|nr:hypothetical protein BD289DRAFT_225192 [Coniella lustricola]
MVSGTQVHLILCNQRTRNLLIASATTHQPYTCSVSLPAVNWNTGVNNQQLQIKMEASDNSEVSWSNTHPANAVVDPRGPPNATILSLSPLLVMMILWRLVIPAFLVLIRSGW